MQRNAKYEFMGNEQSNMKQQFYAFETKRLIQNDVRLMAFHCGLLFEIGLCWSVLCARVYIYTTYKPYALAEICDKMLFARPVIIIIIINENNE